VKPRLEIGADEDLTQDKEKEFPVAISQWKMVAGLLLEARGAVVAKPERVRPLWLVFATRQNSPSHWRGCAIESA